MNTVQVDIVTPEKKVFEGQATMVVAVGVEGELGVMPGHAPLVTPLKIGVLRVKNEQGEQKFAVSGGFLEVRPDKITVLADTAELPEEIDVERAQKAKERAEELRRQLKREDAEFRLNELALERALNRLKLANRR